MVPVEEEATAAEVAVAVVAMAVDVAAVAIVAEEEDMVCNMTYRSMV